MHAGSAVLRGVTQDLLQIFEAEVPAQAAERQPPRRQTTSSDPDRPASPGWQGKAAAAVVALAEVLFGASALWQGTQQEQQQQQKKRDTSSQYSQLDSSFSTTTAGDPMTAHASTDGKKSPHSLPSSDLADAAAHTDSNVLEPLVVQALDDFSNAGVWFLATHLDSDAAVPGSTPLTPEVHRVDTCTSSCCSRLGPLCVLMAAVSAGFGRERRPDKGDAGGGRRLRPGPRAALCQQRSHSAKGVAGAAGEAGRPLPLCGHQCWGCLGGRVPALRLPLQAGAAGCQR